MTVFILAQSELNLSCLLKKVLILKYQMCKSKTKEIGTYWANVCSCYPLQKKKIKINSVWMKFLSYEFMTCQERQNLLPFMLLEHVLFVDIQIEHTWMSNKLVSTRKKCSTRSHAVPKWLRQPPSSASNIPKQNIWIVWDLSSDYISPTFWDGLQNPTNGIYLLRYPRDLGR